MNILPNIAIDFGRRLAVAFEDDAVLVARLTPAIFGKRI